jgi:hypothetical protein
MKVNHFACFFVLSLLVSSCHWAERDVTAKIFTTDGLEYGRVTVHVKGMANTARFVDFVFDKRTDIDLKGKATLD